MQGRTMALESAADATAAMEDTDEGDFYFLESFPLVERIARQLQVQEEPTKYHFGEGRKSNTWKLANSSSQGIGH